MKRYVRVFSSVALPVVVVACGMLKPPPQPYDDSEPPPAFVELAISEEPPPAIVLRHEAFYAARRATIEAQRTTDEDVRQWLRKYKNAAQADTSLALVRFVSDEGPRQGMHLRASTWAVVTQLAGRGLPPRFTLVQIGVDGEIGEDGSLIGKQGPVYAVIVKRDHNGDYRLINDGTGVYSFFLPVGSGRYVLPGGPGTSLEELETAAKETW
jgi:hypothetical protein